MPLRTTRSPLRLGLWLPFMALFIAIGHYTAYWFYAASQVRLKLDQTHVSLKKSGLDLSWQPYQIKGYPFRFFIELNNFKALAPQGKGMSAPQLLLEANAYSPTKWLVYVPTGASLKRGQSKGQDLGLLKIEAKRFKASLEGLDKPVPKIAIVATDLVLMPEAGKPAFLFATAKKFEAYIRPSTRPDSLDGLWRLSEAKAAKDSVLSQLSSTEDFNLHAEATFSPLGALKVRDLASSIERDWALSQVKLSFLTQSSSVFAQSTRLSIDNNSRLEGEIKLELKGKLPFNVLLASMGSEQNFNAQLVTPFIDLALGDEDVREINLSFKNGYGYLGPIKVSKAPILLSQYP